MDNVILTQISLDELLARVQTIVRNEIAAAGAKPNGGTTSKEKPVTQKELCELLQVTQPTVIRYRKKGKIPFFYIGSAIRYNVQDVLRSLEK